MRSSTACTDLKISRTPENLELAGKESLLIHAGNPVIAVAAVSTQARIADRLILAICIVLALPLLAMALLALGGLTTDTLVHLIRTVLLQAIGTSLALCLGTIAISVVTGVACAWAIERHEFAGRRWLAWLLVLPLAMPTYVIAYAYTDLLQFSGPIQGYLRRDLGWNIRLPDVRSLPGAIILFSVVLYPYVYLLARTAFADLSASYMETARLLGDRRWSVLRRVVLPLAWPSIMAGGMLVLMETLADVGATYYFGLPTFSASIYNTWFNLGDRNAALLLACVLLLFVGLLYWFEQRARGRMQHGNARSARVMPRIQLSGSQAAWLAALLCVPVALGFVFPVAGLIWLLAREPEWTLALPRFWTWTANTFVAGSLGASLTVLLAVAVAYMVRMTASRTSRIAASTLMFGYAVPGAVLALAVLWPMAAADRFISSALGMQQLLIGGTIAGLLYAYLVRFFAVAYGSLAAGMTRITPNLDAAARTLGASRWQAFTRVHLPLLKRPLLAAWILVLIDAMKELPATLMLRPFNFDTLAVVAQNLAKDERLAEAALPALAIVLIGVIPVMAMSRLMNRA